MLWRMSPVKGDSAALFWADCSCWAHAKCVAGLLSLPLNPRGIGLQEIPSAALLTHLPEVPPKTLLSLLKRMRQARPLIRPMQCPNARLLRSS